MKTPTLKFKIRDPQHFFSPTFVWVLYRDGKEVARSPSAYSKRWSAERGAERFARLLRGKAEIVQE